MAKLGSALNEFRGRNVTRLRERVLKDECKKIRNSTCLNIVIQPYSLRAIRICSRSSSDTSDKIHIDGESELVPHDMFHEDYRIEL